jgi:hypothetical protein
MDKVAQRFGVLQKFAKKLAPAKKSPNNKIYVMKTQLFQGCQMVYFQTKIPILG